MEKSTMNADTETSVSQDARELTPEEKTALRRKQLKQQMLATDVSDIADDLGEQQGRQRVRKMSAATAKRVESVHIPKDELPVAEPEVVEDDDPFRDEITAVANRTPEVRFTKAHMLRAFNENELKIIAAALRTSTPLYRVADVLHCSIHKIENAIRDIPILTELAQEKVKRRKEQAQEAVDDCVKARVPAVVMWNAEKILPEIYGNQVNIDNEDDTKLVIGTISEEDLAEADALVEKASSSVPDVEVGGAMEALEIERGAELAAAGGGSPVSPLQQVPPAPAINPPPGDSRFSGFIPASELSRAPILPQPDTSPDNYGAVGGGGFDDFDDGSWI